MSEPSAPPAQRAPNRKPREPRKPRRPDSTLPIAVIPRPPTVTRPHSELRVTLERLHGYDFINLRVWVLNSAGVWWADRTKGLTIPIQDVEAVAEALIQASENFYQEAESDG